MATGFNCCDCRQQLAQAILVLDKVPVTVRCAASADVGDLLQLQGALESGLQVQLAGLYSDRPLFSSPLLAESLPDVPSVLRNRDGSACCNAYEAIQHIPYMTLVLLALASPISAIRQCGLTLQLGLANAAAVSP